MGSVLWATSPSSLVASHGFSWRYIGHFYYTVWSSHHHQKPSLSHWRGHFWIWPAWHTNLGRSDLSEIKTHALHFPCYYSEVPQQIYPLLPATESGGKRKLTKHGKAYCEYMYIEPRFYRITSYNSTLKSIHCTSFVFILKPFSVNSISQPHRQYWSHLYYTNDHGHTVIWMVTPV